MLRIFIFLSFFLSFLNLFSIRYELMTGLTEEEIMRSRFDLPPKEDPINKDPREEGYLPLAQFNIEETSPLKMKYFSVFFREESDFIQLNGFRIFKVDIWQRDPLTEDKTTNDYLLDIYIIRIDGVIYRHREELVFKRITPKNETEARLYLMEVQTLSRMTQYYGPKTRLTASNILESKNRTSEFLAYYYSLIERKFYPVSLTTLNTTALKAEETRVVTASVKAEAADDGEEEEREGARKKSLSSLPLKPATPRSSSHRIDFLLAPTSKRATSKLLAGGGAAGAVVIHEAIDDLISKRRPLNRGKETISPTLASLPPSSPIAPPLPQRKSVSMLGHAGLSALGMRPGSNSFK